MNCVKYFQNCVDAGRHVNRYYTFFNLNHVLSNCYQPRRYAGHSKWANIRHVKSLKDGEKARDMQKMSNLMKVAIKEGGSADPKVNPRLAQVVAKAKEAKLPTATIEKVIQACTPNKDAKSTTVVVKGPGGCVLIVDICSAALNRSKQELNTILRKNKGLVFTENVGYFYEQKGIIRCSGRDNELASPENLEKAVDDGIEVGAEEVNFHDDLEHGKIYEFITQPDPGSFYKVKQTLEKMNYAVAYSDIEYVAVNKVELSESELTDASVLCDKLEGHPDVVRVYANVA